MGSPAPSPDCSYPADNVTGPDRPSKLSFDPELDFLSPSFNAARALATVGLRPPDPSARPLDNLYRCRTLLPPDHPDAMAAPARQPRSKEAAEAAERARARTSVVAARSAARAQRSNPIEEVAARVREGPLALLRRAYAARARVRVVTRHGRGVRGVAEGTLAAFDKHMNMVLRDVEEAYTVLLRGVERLVGPPGCGHTRCAPKQERRTRRLRQAFLRGDSVVLVSAAAGALPPLEQVLRAAALAPTAAAQGAATAARDGPGWVAGAAGQPPLAHAAAGQPP